MYNVLSIAYLVLFTKICLAKQYSNIIYYLKVLNSILYLETECLHDSYDA